MSKTEIGETRPEQTKQETPFLFIGEALALDLMNTEIIVRGKRRDLLVSPQDVHHWWQAACLHHPQREHVQGRNEGAEIFTVELLTTLKALRTALRNIFQALVEEIPPNREDLHVLNHILKTGYTFVDLTQNDELQVSYRSTDINKGMVLLPIALSALHLLREGDRKRIHHCSNERCIFFFYDTTRSATRRWCSLECMDRARSAQRYKKRRSEASL